MDLKKNVLMGVAVFVAVVLSYAAIQLFEQFSDKKTERKYLKLLDADLNYDLDHLSKLLNDDSIDLLNLQFILDRANTATPYDVGDQAFRLLYRTPFTPQCVTYDLMGREANVAKASDLTIKYGLGFLYNQLYPQMQANDQKMAVHINNFLIPHTINAVGVNDDMMRFSLIRNQSYLNALIMYKVMLEISIEARKNSLGYLLKVKGDLQERLE